MGLRGPAPTPAAILRMRGTHRRRKERDPSIPVSFVEGKPACPSCLSKEAKAEWRRIVKHVEGIGLLSEADRAMLAAYCEAWGEFVALVQAVAQCLKEDPEGGMLTAIKTGLLRAKSEASGRLLRLAQQFGLSPSSRRRVHAVEEGGGGESEDGKSKYFA